MRTPPGAGASGSIGCPLRGGHGGVAHPEQVNVGPDPRS